MNYMIDAAQFARWLERDILTAARADIEAYAVSLAQRGLSTSSRARYIIVLRQFFGWAEDAELISISPARKVKPPARKHRVPNFLSVPEVHALRQAIPQTLRGMRDRAVIELGLATLRISEILGLNVEDVAFERRQVHITGKGGEEYMQPIVEDALRATEAWIDVRPDVATHALFIPLIRTGQRRRSEVRLEMSTTQKFFRAYLLAAGITRRLTFHSLRHTAGVRLADRGVPLQYIQDIFRHKDPKTTRIYTQIGKDRLAEVLNRELVFD